MLKSTGFVVFFLFFSFAFSSGSREWVSGRQERNLGTARGAISEGVTAVLRERGEEEKKSQLSPEKESNKEERRRSGWREVEEAAVQYAAISRRVQEARNMLGGQQQ